MTNGELEQLKTHISDRIKELQTALAADENPIEKQPDNLSGAEVDQQIIRQLKQEQAALNKSLERLDSEDAGICDECGSDIPYARLYAVPVTKLCITCAD